MKAINASSIDPRTVESLLDAVKTAETHPEDVVKHAITPTVALLADICERIIALESVPNGGKSLADTASLIAAAQAKTGFRCVECDQHILVGEPWVEGSFGKVHALCDETAVM